MIAIVAAIYHRDPDLSHVRVAFLSGNERGNYYAVVSKLAAEAKRRRGRIDNLPSAGSIENIQRLAAEKDKCRIQFALVQDGLPWPAEGSLELIGRLPTSESLVMVGRDADRIRSVGDLRGKRIGIGPSGSGTEHVARQIMGRLASLDVKVSTHPLQEQLSLVENGGLDLAVMVIDPDAQLITEAIRDRNLQLVDIPGADALAHWLPFARTGRIAAGYYDPIRHLPSTDKRIIVIDTLVIGNGCARESATQGVIETLNRVFPDFPRFNKEQPNLTGLPLDSAARSYYESGGPDPVGAYAPIIIDIMPTARWLQLVFAFSVLFGAQALFHRFRLWRIDARRSEIEGDVAELFEPGITVGEIAAMTPSERHLDAATRERLDAMLADLTKLAKRCRRQSQSIMVPMGHEMAYRYQESLMADLAHALRAFRARLPARE